MRAQSVLSLATFLAFAALAPSSTPEAEVSIVEDWAQQAVGATGVPSGWNPYATLGGAPSLRFYRGRGGWAESPAPQEPRRSLDDCQENPGRPAGDPYPGMDLENHRAPRGCRHPQEGDVRPHRSYLSGVAALSGPAAHSPHRLCVGYNRSGSVDAVTGAAIGPYRKSRLIRRLRHAALFGRT
jgi:hypothetical protein